MTEEQQDRPDEGWSGGRHSEVDEPHEEQEPGSLEEPETVHQPHQGEEGQSEDVA
jgi:hypothetical protein